MKTELHPLGLYIHIPFCRRKCAYCDFYSLSGQEGRMDDYTAALCAHLTETAAYTTVHQVDTVFFGGGTPTLLGEKRLSRILKTIQKKYHMARDPEITLEANPESAGDWKELRRLRKSGFNRLSLGMQSADDRELQLLGRIHSAGETRTAVENARRAGFQNLSLDLIYGLPGQSLQAWQENLRAALDLAPEHLSCYGLQVEEGTPLYARRETLDLPDDEAQAEEYLWTVEELAGQGYRQYEISNFAHPGKESRHNLKYWTLSEYAGFGPGAHSDFGDARYAYARDLEGYIRGVREHTPLLSENERIPQMERDTEWIMLRCRTAEGMDPREFEHRFRRRFTCLLPVLEACREAGYAREEETGCWHLTPRGFLVSNQIIGRLLEALAAEKQRRAEAAARGDFRVALE